MPRVAKIPRSDWESIAARIHSCETKKLRTKGINLIAEEREVTVAAIYQIVRAMNGRPRDLAPQQAERKKPEPARTYFTTNSAIQIDKEILMRGRGQPHKAPLRLKPLLVGGKEVSCQ